MKLLLFYLITYVIRISIKVLIKDVEINAKSLNESFLMNGKLSGEASIPICNEVIFNGDGSVFTASCHNKDEQSPHFFMFNSELLENFFR